MFSAIDNLWKGTSSQALQNLNLMFGCPETEGLAMSASDTEATAARPFFRSRWAPAPAHVRELGPDAGLPAGFRAAGVACGHQAERQPRPRPARVRRAERRSARRASPPPRTPAAPVLLSRERCRLDALRVVLANSGCANAATGRRGLDDAAKTQGAAALAVGRGSGRGRARLDRRRSATYLPVDAVLKGILAAREQLRARRRHRLPAGDPDDRRVREARQPRGGAALRHRASQRPVQGRRA